MFAIPWQNRIIVGTTDTPVDVVPIDPVPLDDELEFLVGHAARYLSKDPTESDVLSVFAGIRPLVGELDESGETSAISRDHTISISNSGLLTIAGGKWTTYRKMAEETVDHAAVIAQLEERPSPTRELNIHGFHRHAQRFGELSGYGSDAPELREVMEEHKGWGERMHPELPITPAHVVWAVREEMARTTEDVLSRRTRCLLLGARASIDIVPNVADLMREELKQSRKWAAEQVDTFKELASTYLPAP
jgi:glycerol-3-phosphate dehydrogenase